MDPNQPQQPPQKLVDFNTELKALCDKYQYELRAVLQFDPLRGIFGVLQAFDVSPKVDEGVALTPSPETPDTTPIPDAAQTITPKEQPQSATPIETPVVPNDQAVQNAVAPEVTSQVSNDPASSETSPSAENTTVDNSSQ